MQVVYKRGLPGEASEGTKEKKPSNLPVISGVAPDSTWSHRALWSMNYISEIVISGGKGVGILYPPRNQSLTKVDLIFCVCGDLTYQALAGEVTPVNKGEPPKVIASAARCIAIRRWWMLGKGIRRDLGRYYSLWIFPTFMPVIPSGQGCFGYPNLFGLFLPPRISWAPLYCKMPAFLGSYSPFEDNKNGRCFSSLGG